MNRPFSLALALVVALGCRSSSDTNTPPNQTTTSQNTSSGQEADASASMLSNDPDASMAPSTTPTPPMPQMGPVAIVPGERRDVPSPTPRVAIRAPANNSTIREDRVEVRLNVQNWRNVNDQGDQRHVHLVLDNEPYRRVDDPTRPVALEHLAQGTHVLRAFPGWETHETVKTDGAFAMVVFHVGAASRDLNFNARAPLLTYSRPKGNVDGQSAGHILLDFYLANVPANQVGAQGFRVRPTIDGTTMDDLTTWIPYYIDNLPDGEHTIGLQLIGRDGQPAPGPFNRAEQRITVNRNPAPTTATTTPDPHAGH